ncbi:MAG: hypothetical protein NDJ18_09010 [candidate division Zixibacteria bacterium]|nr:hypothetical protein [candidate division Zixibacteria bacterium]
MFKRVTLALLALMLLVVVGCSKAPEAEMTAASAAFDAARAAEAEAYVADAFRMAQDTLNAAQAMKTEQDGKFALFRSYGKSKEMFARAQALAEKATADAAAEKERVKAEVMTLMADAKAAMDAATAAVDKAPKGKDTKAEIELIKNSLAALAPAYADAEADFNAGKFLTAKSKFEGVMAQAKSIQDEVAAAAARKAGN